MEGITETIYDDSLGDEYLIDTAIALYKNIDRYNRDTVYEHTKLRWKCGTGGYAKWSGLYSKNIL